MSVQMTSSAGVHNEDLTAGRFNVVISGTRGGELRFEK